MSLLFLSSVVFFPLHFLSSLYHFMKNLLVLLISYHMPYQVLRRQGVVLIPVHCVMGRLSLDLPSVAKEKCMFSSICFSTIHAVFSRFFSESFGVGAKTTVPRNGLAQPVVYFSVPAFYPGLYLRYQSFGPLHVLNVFRPAFLPLL